MSLDAHLLTAGWQDTTQVSLAGGANGTRYTITNNGTTTLAGLRIESTIVQGQATFAAGDIGVDGCGGGEGIAIPGSCGEWWTTALPSPGAGPVQGAALLVYSLTCVSSGSPVVLDSVSASVQMVP